MVPEQVSVNYTILNRNIGIINIEWFSGVWRANILSLFFTDHLFESFVVGWIKIVNLILYRTCSLRALTRIELAHEKVLHIQSVMGLLRADLESAEPFVTCVAL
mgnify:CR=1 FL=1